MFGSPRMRWSPFLSERDWKLILMFVLRATLECHILSCNTDQKHQCQPRFSHAQLLRKHLSGLWEIVSLPMWGCVASRFLRPPRNDILLINWSLNMTENVSPQNKHSHMFLSRSHSEIASYFAPKQFHSTRSDDVERRARGGGVK